MVLVMLNPAGDIAINSNGDSFLDANTHSNSMMMVDNNSLLGVVLL
jgi:hypothetical protein